MDVKGFGGLGGLDGRIGGFLVIIIGPCEERGME